LCLLFPALLLVSAAAAWSAPPTIVDVQVDRALDVDAPDWVSYHQRVTVYASDPDGAGDIWCVEIDDPAGGVHYISICNGGGWQVDPNTVGCEWNESDMLAPPAPGAYSVAVVGVDGWEGLTTPLCPEVGTDHPTLLTPVMDTVTDDPSPTFAWSGGLPCACSHVDLEQEAAIGRIWCGFASDANQVTFDGVLEAGRSYVWTLVSCTSSDYYGTDPRVNIWGGQRISGRFTEYAPYPEVLPDLPGKLAYDSMFTPGWVSPWHSAVMQYSPDPWVRIALGSDHSESPDWSPDGSRLLYAAWGGRLWIDTLDSTPPTLIPGIAGSDCRWAADGNRIVYAVHGPATPYLPEGWSYDIWVANIDGSSTYPLVESLETHDRWPDWSPDGMWIAYRKLPQAMGTAVWLARYDGSEYRPVVPTTLVGYPEYQVGGLTDFAWCADGQKLAVTFGASAPDLPAIDGVGIISRDGGPVTPVFINPPGYVCCAAAGLPQWSPDGTKVVFSSGWHLPYDPDWYDPTGSGLGKFEPGVELWMVNVDGTGDPVRLTYNHSHDYYVTWWAPNTEPGTDVEIVKGDTTVTFADVTETGDTSVTVFNDPPAPEPQGFTFLGDYWEVTTTAQLAENSKITLEIQYDDADVPAGQEEWLALLHWENGEWVDITVRPIDTVNNIITGECTSLSPFGIAVAPYQFNGLRPPVNNDNTSIFKLKSTVPIKFQLVAPDGSYVSNATARLRIAKISGNVTGSFDEAVSTNNPDGGNLFRYDASANQYIFNLGTKGLSTGTWVLQVVVNDLVAKEVQISLK
jgi:Tol biopolymer transport system component